MKHFEWTRSNRQQAKSNEQEVLRKKQWTRSYGQLIPPVKNYNFKVYSHCLLLLASCFFYYNASSQSSLTIVEAIELALKNNVGIHARNLEIQSAQVLKKTAGELPKLDLNVQLGQYSSNNFDNGFQVSQTIPFPTLFSAKKNLAGAEIKGKELQRDISIAELKSQVRKWYYEIHYLQHNQKQLMHLDSLYNDFIRVAALRYKTGDIKKVEVSTATAKKGAIDLLLKQNEVDMHNAYQNLSALMNTDEPFKISSEKEFQPIQVSALVDSASIANHPLLRSLHQEAYISEQSKSVERSQGLPDIKLGYTNQSLIGFQTINGQEKYFDAGDRFNVFHIGVTLPLTFGATKAKIKSLDYKKQAFEAIAIQQQKLMNTQLQNAVQQYHQDLEKYQYYLSQALPNAEEIVTAAQLGYNTGDISYVEYLYALQTATDIQLDYLKSIRDVNQSIITIYSLINK